MKPVLRRRIALLERKLASVEALLNEDRQRLNRVRHLREQLTTLGGTAPARQLRLP